MPCTLLLPLPLPADEVHIGSLLVNPRDPTQDYFDPREEKPDLEPSILRVDVTDFTNTIRDAGSKQVEAVLTDYFLTSIDWGKSKELELSSAKAATYLMKNSSSWFEQVCALARTRRWFEKVIGRGYKIYLLVGLRTIFDGRFKIDHSASTSTSGHVQLPADMLAGLPPMGLDVGGGGKVSKDQTASSEFSAAGERIWALQYRQIKFKWYSSKKMENAALETGTRWLTFDAIARRSIMRAGPREDRMLGAILAGETENAIFSQQKSAVLEDTDDVIEAIIDDELELEDQFEVQHLCRSGETLFIPRQAERRESNVPRGSNIAVDNPGEDV